LLRGIEQTSQYAALTAWRNQQEAEAFLSGPHYQQFLAQHPLSGIATINESATCYRITSEVEQGITNTAYCTITEWLIDKDARGFEDSRYERLKLIKAARTGFLVGVVTWKLAEPQRYQILSAYRDQQAAQQAAANPDVQQFDQEHPFSLYASAPPRITAYAAKSVVLPG
jgi:quinol monooxygenase YgiN